MANFKILICDEKIEIQAGNLVSPIKIHTERLDMADFSRKFIDWFPGLIDHCFEIRVYCNERTTLHLFGESICNKVEDVYKAVNKVPEACIDAVHKMFKLADQSTLFLEINHHDIAKGIISVSLSNGQVEHFLKTKI
ncbi:hypothetical protein LOZ80_03780 [Paenibacillus sp. HWE-109]|uniref:hypothetical protein n=1 Tax=Paenibacillus sp. HWE-109 TaxID=1306526 RepID=UPI001EDEF4A6|nr:hypothetical protein [Paenibacillus sp. HWE-109]UKS28071.1 hypothetical protein LOZ80_03780 [Paenibacillus sp. HWE-109]